MIEKIGSSSFLSYLKSPACQTFGANERRKVTHFRKDESPLFLYPLPSLELIVTRIWESGSGDVTKIAMLPMRFMHYPPQKASFSGHF